MNKIILQYLEKPELSSPILIEGLPGVGNVGKLAAEHLIEELCAKKFLEIYSYHFPPQVLVEDGGVVRLVSNEMYYHKMPKGDLIILVGDYQGLTPEGQYELSSAILDIAEGYGVKELYTLGGYGTGNVIEKCRVIGATTHPDLVEKMQKYNVEFPRGEPNTGIVGASGLLLGLGKLRGMEGVCLMGETSGYFVDPKAAQAVLEVLQNILGIKLDFSRLEMRAAQIDKITSQLQRIEDEIKEEHKREDLPYIG